MTRLTLAFVLGAIAGVASGVAYTGWGEGFGDMDYTHYDFAWRGRRIEIHLEKV